MTTRTPEVLRLPGKSYDFISDEGFRRTERNGVAGTAISVRLTSYRSLPLSCIAEIALAIDGVGVAPADITFVIDGHAYPLLELRERVDIWWFVLDYAELFVPRALEGGTHDLTGTLTTIVPFATGGRTTHSRSSAKSLVLEDGQE